MSRSSWLTALAIALIFAVAPVLGLARSSEPMILPVDDDPLIVEAAAGEARFTVEIADTNEARARGLMFREEMADDHGMLFVFDDTRPVSFWMRNTPLPLDLVFIGEDGKVRAVKQGEPFSTDPIGPPDPVRFVLEINAGMALETGIEEDTRLSHPRIDAVAGE
jgi:uncharacterized protein